MSNVVTTRTETKQRTREALLEAAEEVFGEQGLDTPSLDAICERAGKTRGAFYVHFRDRDDLLVAVMERVGRAFLDDVLGPAGSPAGGDAAADAAALAATFGRFVSAVSRGEYPLMRGGGVRPHQLLDACVRSPAIRDRYVGLVQDSIERLGRIVDLGQAAGIVRGDVPSAQVATMVLAAVIGAQTMAELRIELDLAGAAASFLTVLGQSGASAPAIPPAAAVRARSPRRRSPTRSTSSGRRRGR
jgi:TetR/AcrR family transcriptional repressor of nem operon